MKLSSYCDVFLGLNKSRIIFKKNLKFDAYEYNIVHFGDELIINKYTLQVEKILCDKKIDKKFLINKGDILVKVGKNISFHYVDIELNNAILTSNYYIIRCNGNDKKKSEKIWFFLNTTKVKLWILNRIEKNQSNNTINISTINNLIINLNEINEQKLVFFKKINMLIILQKKKTHLLNKILKII